MAFTHAINVSVGFNLTKILAPENIPGVKAYLGIESDDDLASAILQDKFISISNLLSQGGFKVINAEVQAVQKEAKPSNKTVKVHNEPVKEAPKQEQSVENKAPDKAPDKVVEEPEAQPEIKDAANDKELFDKKEKFLKRILKIISGIKRKRGSIEIIRYSPDVIPYAPSPEEFKHEGRMSSDVTIDVEEIDKGLLATISYLDKDGKLQTELLKEDD